MRKGRTAQDKNKRQRNQMYSSRGGREGGETKASHARAILAVTADGIRNPVGHSRPDFWQISIAHGAFHTRTTISYCLSSLFHTLQVPALRSQYVRTYCLPFPEVQYTSRRRANYDAPLRGSKRPARLRHCSGYMVWNSRLSDTPRVRF